MHLLLRHSCGLGCRLRSNLLLLTLLHLLLTSLIVLLLLHATLLHLLLTSLLRLLLLDMLI